MDLWEKKDGKKREMNELSKTIIIEVNKQRRVVIIRTESHKVNVYPAREPPRMHGTFLTIFPKRVNKRNNESHFE